MASKYLIVPAARESFLTPYFTNVVGDAELDSHNMGLRHIFDVENNKRMVYHVVWEGLKQFDRLPEPPSRPEQLEL